MSGNLSARLKRIRASTKTYDAERRASLTPPPRSAGVDLGFRETGWIEAAPWVLRRHVDALIGFPPAALDPGLAVLCPSARDAFSGGLPVEIDRVLLFDLETTGLSGGAGTVAFLAAFGRFVRAGMGDGAAKLSIDQYLLLDYPGESVFLELVLSEFAPKAGEPVLGSYNGRSFDMQILRTRCIMNGFSPPNPAHLDLVHAARRLWRRRLPSCSLADVERGVLGFDRGEDLPGSEAPDAWFDFLKTGAVSRLIAVGDHNRRDLEGLAALLVRMDAIARDPESAAVSGELDAEGLAMRWLAAAKAARRSEAAGLAGMVTDELERRARSLLSFAVEAGALRAAFALAGEFARAGEAERAAALRRRVAEADDQVLSAGLRAAACAALSVDALKRLRDLPSALAWLDRALSLEGLSAGARGRLEGRRERIARRIGGR